MGPHMPSRVTPPGHLAAIRVFDSRYLLTKAGRWPVPDSHLTSICEQFAIADASHGISESARLRWFSAVHGLAGRLLGSSRGAASVVSGAHAAD